MCSQVSLRRPPPSSLELSEPPRKRRRTITKPEVSDIPPGDSGDGEVALWTDVSRWRVRPFDVPGRRFVMNFVRDPLETGLVDDALLHSVRSLPMGVAAATDLVRDRDVWRLTSLKFAVLWPKKVLLVMADASSCHQGVVGLAIATNVRGQSGMPETIYLLRWLYAISNSHYPVDVLPRYQSRAPAAPPMDKLKAFDAYPKTHEDFRVRTVSGALISILCAALMLWLFVGEFSYYLAMEVRPEISVDTTRAEKLRINFDITYHHIGCAFLGADSMDIAGEHQLDLEHGVYKRRLDRFGNPVSQPEKREDPTTADALPAAERKEDPACGSCYGAETKEGQCCTTCSEVREAYKARGWNLDPTTVAQCVAEGNTAEMREQKESHEGCRIYGYISVNKVAGNFHVAPGRSYQQSYVHIHDTQMLGDVNVSHTINSFSFGEPFPGMVNPLDNTTNTDARGSSMFQYFIKVVPTSYVSLDGRVLTTNQYSVTEHSKSSTLDKQQGGHAVGHDDKGLPGTFFMYDMSPVLIKFVETRRSFAHFLTGVCAIVGGVFTVAGLVDSAVYNSLRSFKAKVELGKHF
eukprot:m51a1_g6871 putative endoplasmic reticulum-golgi intermediate compartment protein 3-like isoform x2 (576) ;mRNA; f:168986-173271